MVSYPLVILIVGIGVSCYGLGWMDGQAWRRDYERRTKASAGTEQT